ncbi:energy-coupling factor transporter transmembrane component T [Brevibacillus laterosporus]|uniref:energy-coupling factor transporter transmembrane component T family protein n=1 Tax=Brevibacillus TaxID=55080 RepID=UPI001B1EBC10|nr:energy-coupling factor transporter transmembrane component T [Brevibacillus halotolerans]GIO03564.1 energy-coupling factor transporter transmembrane protein EcfT [Brevibacillus halotolerans]
MSMLQNFAIGQYIPGDSFVHRLDPRSKFLFIIVFAMVVFMANKAEIYGFLVAILLLCLFMSKLSLSYILRGLKPVWFLLLLTVILQILLTKGGQVYVRWGWFSIEEEGVRQALFVSMRLGLLVVISSLLTLTTSPIDLTDGVERMFGPLKKWGLPVHEMALMLSIAIRFIPTLLEETDKIMKAQMARGANFDSGTLLSRAKAMVAIVIPLFISAFRRAEDLALAMEARGYRGDVGRTKLRQLQFSYRDGILLLFMLVLVAVVGWWRT